MACVYRARQQSMQREVALKVLDRGLAADPGLVARFERERDVVSRLNHPHILPVYDYGQEGDLLYIAMQLVEGGSLDQHPHLPTELAARLLEQLCSALEYAHRQGVIHRDLKPSNLLLDDGPHLYLMDFGIARLSESANLTTTGSLVGTPAYLPPEQLTGAPATPRSDVYSAGVLAFELFTGQRPFEGELFSVIQKHLNQPPPPLRELKPELPEELEWVLDRALAKDPEQRIASAQDLGAALAAAVAGRRGEVERILGRGLGDHTLPGIPLPVVEEPPAAATPATRPIPRGPRKTPLALGLGVLALAGLGLGLHTRLGANAPTHPLGYAVMGSDSSNGSADIRLQNPDGSGSVLVNGASTPHFSPAGPQMTFDRQIEGQNQEVFLKDRQTGSERNLTAHPALDFWGVFRPDGRSVIFHSNRDGGRFHLFEQNLVDGSLQQLTRGPGNDQWAAVSPDGRWIAFSSDRNGSPGLWLLGPEKGEPRTLIQEGARFPAWSPDGRQLAFQSSRNGRSAIYLVDLADPGQVRPLVATPGEQQWPTWAPSSNLAFSVGGNVMTCAPDGTGLHALTGLTPPALAAYPCWSY